MLFDMHTRSLTHSLTHRLTLRSLVSIDVYEREPTLIADTQLLIEHLEAEGMRVNRHLLLFLVSTL